MNKFCCKKLEEVSRELYQGISAISYKNKEFYINKLKIVCGEMWYVPDKAINFCPFCGTKLQEEKNMKCPCFAVIMQFDGMIYMSVTIVGIVNGEVSKIL